jgi:hypothetical protein
MTRASNACGMFSIKLVGAVQPNFPVLTRAGNPALMNFPSSREGRRVAACTPIGHKSLVYLQAPTMRIWAAIEYIEWDGGKGDVLEQGRRAAEAQGIVELMKIHAPHYASIWRCIRYLAEVTPPEQGLLMNYDFHQGEVIREISREEYERLFNATEWTWPTMPAGGS